MALEIPGITATTTIPDTTGTMATTGTKAIIRPAVIILNRSPLVQEH
jgi:hypothetical protein